MSDETMTSDVESDSGRMLRTQDALRDAHDELRRLVGNRCWATSVKRHVKIGGECDSPNCSAPARHRIALNVWGTVGEFDLCSKCAFHDD